MEAFLHQHLTPDAVAAWSKPVQPSTAFAGRIVVADAPLHAFDRALARIMWHWKTHGYQSPRVVVANEGAAVMILLLLLGYTADDIIHLRIDGVLDVKQLIEGNTKLTGKLSRFHKRKDGAEHKGHRFRDMIHRLIRGKVGGDETAAYTFEELLGRIGIDFSVTVFELPRKDGAGGEVVMLSASTTPKMNVADAILATCAVQPYISRVSFTADGYEREFISASAVRSFPLYEARVIAARLRIPDPNFNLNLVGFACRDAKNPYAENGIETVRQPADIPHELTSRVTIV